MNSDYLFSLASNNNLQAIEQMILDRKIDVHQLAYNEIDSDGNGIITPLEKAVILGNIQIVKVLLNCINEFSGVCRSSCLHAALRHAIYYNNITLIDMLWREIIPDYKNIIELCNFMMLDAVRGSHESIVLKLLSLGADVNYINREYARTPLMEAAEINNVSMIRLLISNGADPKLGFDDGSSWCSALNCAMWEGTPDAFQYLLNFYKNDLAYMNVLLKSAISCNDVNFSLIEQLIIGGCNVNVKFEGGGTPLIEAVRSGFTKPIQFLVKSGADVNLADDLELTPLLWATYYNLQEAIDYLSPLTSLEIKNLIQKQLSDEQLLEKLLFPDVVQEQIKLT
jgi:ankyrin repeat protein